MPAAPNDNSRQRVWCMNGKVACCVLSLVRTFTFPLALFSSRSESRILGCKETWRSGSFLLGHCAEHIIFIPGTLRWRNWHRDSESDPLLSLERYKILGDFERHFTSAQLHRIHQLHFRLHNIPGDFMTSSKAKSFGLSAGEFCFCCSALNFGFLFGPGSPFELRCAAAVNDLLLRTALNWKENPSRPWAPYPTEIHFTTSLLLFSLFSLLQCSVRECGIDHLLNRKAVEDFRQMFGQKGSFITCYYDPQDIQWGAVTKMITPGMPVLHAMIWPTASLMLGSLVCVIFCHWCRKTIKDDKDDNATDALVDNKSDKSGSGRSDKGSNGSRDAKGSRENTPSKRKSSSLPRLDIIAQRLATSGIDDSPAPSPNPYRVCPSGSSSSPQTQRVPKSPSAPPLVNVPSTTSAPGSAAAKVPPKTRMPIKPKRAKMDKSLMSPRSARLKQIKEEVVVSKEDIPLTVTVTEQDPTKDKDARGEKSREGEADVWLW